MKKNLKESLVTAIIPTYQRPDSVCRAVQSVLNQTYENIECIVVSDGPDKETRNALNQFTDSRVVYIENPVNKGVSAARNHGIQKSNGEWIALLDDDDWWDPKKIELQLTAAHEYLSEFVVVAGREKIIYSTGESEIKPYRLPSEYDTLDQYIFSLNEQKKSGYMHTSTLMAPKSFFDQIPFNEQLERHEDWQWLIDVNYKFKAKPIVVKEVITYRQEEIERLSRPGGFDYTKKWYLGNQKKLSSKAKAGLICGPLTRKAAYDKKLHAFPWLLKELKQNKFADKHHLMKLLTPWIIPSRIRISIRKKLRTYS